MEDNSSAKDKFLKGTPFKTRHGEYMRYKESAGGTGFISKNNTCYYATVIGINRSSFTMELLGVKKKFTETVEFENLKFEMI